MIFVTVGTDTHQFDRLLKEMDSLIAKGKIKDETIAQTGNSTYIPKNYTHSAFFSDEKFLELVEKADLIISHAGAGSVITALEHQKPLILVPRMKEYHEHTDNHQADLAIELEKEKRAVCVYDISGLFAAIKKVREIKLKTGKKTPDKIIRMVGEKLKEWCV